MKKTGIQDTKHRSVVMRPLNISQHQKTYRQCNECQPNCTNYQSRKETSQDTRMPKPLCYNIIHNGNQPGIPQPDNKRA